MVCSKCKLEKGKEFFCDKKSYCKTCRNAARNAKNYEVTLLERQCNKCRLIKPANQFHRNKMIFGGLNERCKECRKADTEAAYLKHNEKIKKRTLEYYKNNIDKIRISMRKRAKERRKNDVLWVLKRRLRNRLYYALKRNEWKKDTGFNQYLGCDLEELKQHLEKQFKPGMTWENRSSVWDIDHIIPLSVAKTPEEIYKLCHYTNLAPLEKYENRVTKRDKVSISNFYKIKPLDKELANDIVKSEHYLQRSVAIKYSFGLYDYYGEIKGVIIYSHPSSPHISNNLFGKKTRAQILELSRLWVDDSCWKNTESYFIANTIKHVDADVIISYADPQQNHKGVIYQATNFLYLGLTKKTKEYQVLTDLNRSAQHKGYTMEDLKAEYGENNVLLVDRPRKHVYLYIKNKKLKQLLKKPIMPYPKHC